MNDRIWLFKYIGKMEYSEPYYDEGLGMNVRDGTVANPPEDATIQHIGGVGYIYTDTEQPDLELVAEKVKEGD